MKRAHAMTALALVLAGLVLTAGASAVQEKAAETPPKAAETPEKFSANLMTSAATGTRSTRLNMTVERWATAEEIAGFKKLLEESGPEALYNVLRATKMGSIKTTQSYVYNIFLAYSVQTEEGRTVKLITERPVFFGEAVKDSKSLEYIYSAIEMTLNAKGKGSGKILPTAKIFIGKDGQVDVDTQGQPQTLMNAKKG